MQSKLLAKKVVAETEGASAEQIKRFKNEVEKHAKEKMEVEEGCLSVRWLYGTVARSTKATVTAINEKGEKVTRGASGLLAQIFQHETDHLNGTLFIDKAEAVWEMTAEEIADAQRK